MFHDEFSPHMTLGTNDYQIYDGPIQPQWQEIAEEKGYEVLGRARDRYHLVLRHDECGREMLCKIFTLRTSLPTCPHCLEDRRIDLCRGAGVTFLGRDETPGYFRIRLACGHETSRQQELLERARDGHVEIRCGDCLDARLEAEADARGWTLVGADPEGHQNYRQYNHECGHKQRVAIINMRTGRFTCGACSEMWTSAPSSIYLMRFALAGGRIAVKVGFSRDPVSRLRHQLVTRRNQKAELVRVIPVPTGHEAIRHEKRLHAALRRAYPDAVLESQEFAGQVRVLSELYDSSIEAEIMTQLDDVELRVTALAKHVAKRARRAERHAERRRRNRLRR